jgi:hypothetical protein
MINLCGAGIGNQLVEGPANPTGHWEDEVGVEINRRILEESGGDWDHPPDDIKISWELRQKMMSFVVNAHQEKDKIVWKDPRLSLTFGEWKKLITNYSLVVPFRHPLEVAESLRVRNNFSFLKSENLWFNYNKSVVQLCDLSKCEKVFINFSKGKNHICRKVKKVCEINSLKFTEESKNFYDPNVVKSGKYGGELDRRTVELYNELERRARD